MIEFGHRIGSLTVGDFLEKHPKTGNIYNCACDCGTKMRVSEYRIKTKALASCVSCGHKRAGRINAKHGLSGSPEYKSWNRMMARGVYGSSPYQKERYTDRGIVVIPPLDNFEVFLAQIGRKPSPIHTVERIKNNLPYQIGNIRWATPKEQANNRSNNRLISYNGVTKTLQQWADEIGFRPETITARLGRGYTMEQALSRQNFRVRHLNPYGYRR